VYNIIAIYVSQEKSGYLLDRKIWVFALFSGDYVAVDRLAAGDY
jgi:hypothetical protein